MSNAKPQPSKRSLHWFRSRLLEWFDEYGRQFPWREADALLYVQVVSEILLQRTQAETVAKFFPGFIAKFPTWKELSEAENADIEAFLKPIGLWRRRTSSLKKLATIMATRKGVFPESRSELETLPNVGQYIANAIEMFSSRKAGPLLDVNMARVLERFFSPRVLADIRHDPYLQILAGAVVQHNSPEKINWAILDLAALICRIRPRCEICPLKQKCTFFTVYRDGTGVE